MAHRKIVEDTLTAGLQVHGERAVIIRLAEKRYERAMRTLSGRDWDAQRTQQKATLAALLARPIIATSVSDMQATVKQAEKLFKRYGLIVSAMPEIVLSCKLAEKINQKTLVNRALQRKRLRAAFGAFVMIVAIGKDEELKQAFVQFTETLSTVADTAIDSD